MDFVFIIIIILAGLLGGFLAGMLGVGGGMVFIPVIQYIIQGKVPEQDVVYYTVANSLVIIFIVGAYGWFQQKKLKNTDTKSTIVTGVSAVLSSLLISYLLKEFNLTNVWLFKIFFALLLTLTVLRVLYSRFKKQEEITELVLPPPQKFIPIGLFTGLITALTGLGGGVLLVPYFNKVMKLPVKFSTGLSLSVIPIIAFPLIIFYLMLTPNVEVMPGTQTGYIMWLVTLPISVFAAFATKIGIKTAQKMKPASIMLVFLIFALITLIKVLIYK